MLGARKLDDMADVTDIIAKLVERTGEGRVVWQTSADEDTFIAGVANTSVSVSAYEDNYGDQRVRFRILNWEGREIELYDTGISADDEIRATLTQLHSMARRVALGVDSQLDDLLEALG